MDYDKDSDITKDFFKSVQNKLHLATHGQTAAEIIFNRVDANKDNIGQNYQKNFINITKKRKRRLTKKQNCSIIYVTGGISNEIKQIKHKKNKYK